MTDNILICQCGSVEHQIIWIYDPSDEETLACLRIHLSEQNFCQRLIKGIKYIFGYKCKHGHWDEVHLDKSKVKELKTLCENALNSDTN
jgi:hypothetical protein